MYIWLQNEDMQYQFKLKLGLIGNENSRTDEVEIESSLQFIQSQVQEHNFSNESNEYFFTGEPEESTSGVMTKELLSMVNRKTLL
jgi:hypothetical protein